jgi:uncharacterized protein YegJ (DUF2314 family)
VTCIGGYLVAGALRPHGGKGNLSYVHKVDPELQNAIETARRQLPDFRKALAKMDPEVKSFAIKARLTPVDTTLGPEYIWVDQLNAVGEDFQGVLTEEPHLATQYHKGDKLTVKDADVVDWLILHRDGLHDGAYTDDLLRKRQG